MRRFAKPLYGLTPVPRVRIPPSPPDVLSPVPIVVYLAFFLFSITSIAVSRHPERCILGAYSRDRSNCCIADATSQSAVLM